MSDPIAAARLEGILEGLRSIDAHLRDRNQIERDKLRVERTRLIATVICELAHVARLTDANKHTGMQPDDIHYLESIRAAGLEDSRPIEDYPHPRD